MRLDKYLADAGAGTRSEVKKMIAAGRVTEDGKALRDAGYKLADPDTARICVDGAPVRYASYEYYMLYKPKGVISASRDAGTDAGDKPAVCVTDLITDKVRKDLFPVGRLDKDTTGLLLITNDGQLSHRLLSPSKHVDKTYYAELDGVLMKEAAKEIEAGVDIGDEKPTLPCRIERLSENTCHITIREGRYHQIKRMFHVAGLQVTGLKRLSMGPLTLDPALRPGEYRPLTAEELAALYFERQ